MLDINAINMHKSLVDRNIARVELRTWWASNHSDGGHFRRRDLYDIVSHAHFSLIQLRQYQRSECTIIYARKSVLQAGASKFLKSVDIKVKKKILLKL